MATYDTFLTRCPDCGETMEFQSKARYGSGGDFEYFRLAELTRDVPDWLRHDLTGAELTCHPCGRRVRLDENLEPQRMLHRGRKDP